VVRIAVVYGRPPAAGSVTRLVPFVTSVSRNANRVQAPRGRHARYGSDLTFRRDHAPRTYVTCCTRRLAVDVFEKRFCQQFLVLNDRRVWSKRSQSVLKPVKDIKPSVFETDFTGFVAVLVLG